MKYLLLINKDEAKYTAMTDAERAALHARYEAMGARRGGQRRDAVGCDARTHRVGEIAGLAIVEVPDLDAALALAATHPHVEWASVEVRPIVPWDAHGKAG
jgi:hypothetical protein